MRRGCGALRASTYQHPPLFWAKGGFLDSLWVTSPAWTVNHTLLAVLLKLFMSMLLFYAPRGSHAVVLRPFWPLEKGREVLSGQRVGFWIFLTLLSIKDLWQAFSFAHVGEPDVQNNNNKNDSTCGMFLYTSFYCMGCARTPHKGALQLCLGQRNCCFERHDTTGRSRCNVCPHTPHTVSAQRGWHTLLTRGVLLSE